MLAKVYVAIKFLVLHINFSSLMMINQLAEYPRREVVMPGVVK